MTLLASVLLTLAGCAQLAGRPDRALDRDKLISALEKRSLDLIIDDYYTKAKDDAARQALRNELIDRSIILVDQHYGAFVDEFSSGKKSLDSAADISSMATATASTLVTPVLTKSILSAISGGITASKASIDKNFLYDQTILVLIKQMEAQRREAIVGLLGGRRKPLDQYSLAEALADIERYYFAGTFDGALAGVQQQAARVRDEAEKKVERLRESIDEQLETAAARKTVWDRVFADDGLRAKATDEFEKLVKGLDEKRSGKVLMQGINVLHSHVSRLQDDAKKAGMKSKYLDVSSGLTKELLISYLRADADALACSALFSNVEASLDVEFETPK